MAVERAGALAKKHHADQADQRRHRHVDRNCHRRLVPLVQDRRDDRRRTARCQRRELIPERRTAVANTGGKALGDERGLRAVLEIMKRQAHEDRQKHERRAPGVQQREIQERKHHHHDAADGGDGSTTVGIR